MSSKSYFNTSLRLSLCAAFAVCAASAVAEHVWDNHGGDSRMVNGDNWYIDGTDPREYGAPDATTDCKMEGALAVLNAEETFSANNAFFGRWGSPTAVDVTNGTMTVAGSLTLGRYGQSTEMNIFDGTVTTKTLVVGNWGSHDYNKLFVHGGNVTVTGGSWPGAIIMGLQSESRGEMTVKGGKVVAQNTVHVGFSNLMNQGGPSASYHSLLSVEGGEMSVAGSIEVGNADGDNIGGGGRLAVSGGTLDVTGDINIGASSNAWGRMDITGGQTTVGGTVRVGNKLYAQHAVLNVAGGYLDAGSISVARHCDATVYVTDGGTISVDSISKDQGAEGNAYYYFDRGTVVAKAGYEYTFASASGITIGDGGLTFDTAGYNVIIQAYPSIEGSGGITKTGAGTLELRADTFGYDGIYNAHGVISVEKGTLKLPANQTIYCEGTSVADGATLDLNGSTVTVVTRKAVTSYWTNAAGDASAANAANWRSVVKFYDEDGVEVTSLAEVLDGVMPTADSYVRIPTTLPYPVGFDESTVKGVYRETSSDISLIVDAGASYEDYSGGSFIVTGDVKLLNSLNGLLYSAAAWYDPSDTATLTFGAESAVSGIANKGHLGAAMDGRAYDANSLPYVGNDGWLNFSNCFGFVSANTIALDTDRGRSLFSVNTRQDLWETGAEKQIFPISMGEDSQWTPEKRFFAIECWSWTIKNFYLIADGTAQEVAGIGNDEGVAFVRSLVAANGVVSSDTADYSDNALRTRGNSNTYDSLISGVSPYVYYGMRKLYGTTSLGTIGESLAFDYGVSSAGADAVRQYLAAKWLDGDLPMPSVGKTVLDSLLLENDATVDLDGASVEFGSLGGSGTVSNATSVALGSFLVNFTNGKSDGVTTIRADAIDISNATIVGAGVAGIPRNNVKVVVMRFTPGTLSGKFKSIAFDVPGYSAFYDNVEGTISVGRAQSMCVFVR